MFPKFIFNLAENNFDVKARNWFSGYAMFGAGITTGKVMWEASLTSYFVIGNL